MRHKQFVLGVSLLFVFMFLSTNVYAGIDITTNNASQSVWNETFSISTGGNSTFWISIPEKSTISAADFNVTGLNNSAWEWGEYISPSDAQSWGSDWTNTGNAYDNNWATYAEAYNNNCSDGITTEFIQNFTIPYAESAINDIEVLHQIKQTVRPVGADANVDLCMYRFNTQTWACSDTFVGETVANFTRRKSQLTGDYIDVDTVMMKTLYYSSFSACGEKMGLYDVAIKYQNSTTRYPTDSYIIIEGDSNYVWNYTGAYSNEEIASSFESYVNSYLDTCTFVDGYCNVPFIIHSGTQGILELDVSNTFTYIPAVYDYDYTDSVIEGDVDTFSLNVDTNSNVTDMNATLIYNGTEYTAVTKSNVGQIYNFTYDLTIPSVSSDTNITFWWNATYEYNSTIYEDQLDSANQTIQDYGISVCGSNPYLNFTFWDLATGDPLNVSTVTGTAWSEYGDAVTSVAISETDTYNVSLCVDPSIYDYTINASLAVTGNSSYKVSNVYYPPTLLSNSTTEEKVYLILTADGWYVRFHVQDGLGSVITGALVSASVFYDGEYHLATSGYTDDSGTATLFLDPDLSYYIVTTASGYSSDSSTITPTTQDYYITLGGGGTGGNVVVNSTSQTIATWSAFPVYSYVYNNLTTFNFSCDGGSETVSYYGMSMYLNGTLQLYSNNTTGDCGFITQNLNLTNYTDQYIQFKYWFRKVGKDEFWIQKNIYVIATNMTGGNHTIISAFNLLTDESLVTESNSNAFTLLVIFIAIVVASFVTYRFGTGASFIVMGVFTVFRILYNFIDIKIIVGMWIVAFAIAYLRGGV